MESRSARLEDTLRRILSPYGLECYPFKIEWYNEKVAEIYRLLYPSDTLAFSILSTPDMFQNAFIPFILNKGRLNDPDVECMEHLFDLVKQELRHEDIEVMHVCEMTSSDPPRPKVLVQTAGHVSGAAYYYQQFDLDENTWTSDKKLFGVSVHPQYGGWFGFRGVLIFKNTQCPDLKQQLPVDCVPTQEKRKELLELVNYHWQDSRYRDIIPPRRRFSEEEKLYLQTKKKDRHELIEKMKEEHMRSNEQTTPKTTAD